MNFFLPQKIKTVLRIFRDGGLSKLLGHTQKRLADVCYFRSLLLMKLDLRNPTPELPSPFGAVRYKYLSLNDQAQISRLSACLTGLKENEIKERLIRGERVSIAERGEEIMAVAWATEKGEYSIPYLGWKKPLPAQAVYGYGLYVLPGFRGKGIGLWLMRNYFQEVKNQGYVSALAAVEFYNRSAIRSNTRLGFRPLKRLFGFRFFGIRIQGTLPLNEAYQKNLDIHSLQALPIQNKARRAS